MVVRDSETLQILSLQTCLDPVQRLEWSPDSQFVMCGMYKRGVVQVHTHSTHADTGCVLCYTGAVSLSMHVAVVCTK